MIDPRIEQTADALLKEWSDRGRIIEGGWQVYEAMSGIMMAPEKVRRKERKIFFLGATFLFSSLFRSKDEGGEEVTKDDIEKVQKIANEVKKFLKDNVHEDEGKD